MFIDVLPYSDLVLLDDAVWMLTAETGMGVYDFRIDRFFPCRRWDQQQPVLNVVARIGAFPNYEPMFNSLVEDGIRLIHTPDEHQLCSELSGWYSLLEDITPKSFWFDQPPEPEQVAECLDWPVFVKGARQTSRHRRSLSIIDGPDSFRHAMTAYRQDPILRWQSVVCREFVRLRPVQQTESDTIPSSFEFRTFWWKGNLVGFGPYWWQGKAYQSTDEERKSAVDIAQEAAKRIGVGFVVVDVAQTDDGRWIVIECNDGQESGYAGVTPVGLWQNIINFEKSHAC